MSLPFDEEAVDYDDNFTKTPIGKYQRHLVWHWLDKSIVNFSGKHLLEINCGTGEDAIHMTEQGAKVLATDISAQMIDQAQNKLNYLTGSKPEFKRLDIREMAFTIVQENAERFDMIFSNFGGLNCLDHKELKDFFINASDMLQDKGRIIVVLMAKHCLWERMYFSFKGKKPRRNTENAVHAEIAGTDFPVWYYSRNEIRDISRDLFKIKSTKPIGFFIPPSYLNKYFSKHKVIFKLLKKLDSLMRSVAFLSDYSDHIYIELEKK